MSSRRSRNERRRQAARNGTSKRSQERTTGFTRPADLNPLRGIENMRPTPGEDPRWAHRVENNLRAVPPLVHAAIYVVFIVLSAIGFLSGFVKVEFRRGPESITP